MTTVYFGGAEAPTLRNRLQAAGARAVSIGLLDLWPRIGEDGEFDVRAAIPEARVLLDMQGRAATRRDMTHPLASTYVETMLRIVYDNREAIDGVIEFDYEPWGYAGVQEGRDAFFDNMEPGKFLPVWHPEWEAFERLAEKYQRVAVSGDVLKNLSTSEARRLRKTALTSNVRIHGMTSAQDVATDLRLDSLSFASWIACTSRGETTLWERNRIKRYRGEEKDEVRRTKRALIEQAGVDPDDVADDDPQALTTLAISAWQAWGDHNARGRTGQPTAERHETSLQLGASTPVQPTKYRWNGEPPEGMSTLPLLAPEQSSNSEGFEVSTVQSSMRRCGTCSLAGLCPMEVGPEEDDDRCRIAIPVEIRDKSQLVAILRTMLELQGQRALFSKFAEDVEGGGASSDTSAELDRFMRMSQQMKEVLEEHDFLRITVEGKGAAGSGVLSQLFGAGVGSKAREIDPTDADSVVAEVLEG